MATYNKVDFLAYGLRSFPRIKLGGYRIVSITR